MGTALPSPSVTQAWSKRHEPRDVFIHLSGNNLMWSVGGH